MPGSDEAEPGKLQADLEERQIPQGLAQAFAARGVFGDRAREELTGPRNSGLVVVSALAVLGDVETLALFLFGRTKTDDEAAEHEDDEGADARPH